MLHQLKENLSKRLSLATKLRLKRLASSARQLLIGEKALQSGAEGERDLELASLAGNRPYVLVIDERVPTPDRDAGSARMFLILGSLAEWARVVFVAVGKPLSTNYENALLKEGIEIASVLDYLRLLKAREFCAAVISRPEVAEALMPEVRRADPNIKIVYDMVDAHFVRFRREHAVTGLRETLRKAENYRRVEVQLARRSDIVWCASTEDAKALRAEVGDRQMVVIPTIHPLRDRGKPFRERRDLLFIGSLHHTPNSDGIRYYLEEIHPAVREALAGVKLYIIGDGATAEIRSYASDDVRVMGYVPDVSSMFRDCRLMIAPLRFGAGAKGKVGEALSHGLPVVTTSIGAEGMGFTNGEELIVADTANDFALAVRRLYTDEALWQRLSDKGYDFVESHLSPSVLGKLVNDSVRDLCERERNSV